MASGQKNPQASTEGSSAMENGVSGPAATSSSGEDVWDEQRIEESLKVLKEMHIQLRGLRTTIPRLIAPLITKHSSPEKVFREFSASATTANQEVQEFRRLMNSQQGIEVMENARKSRAENPNGIKPWRVTEHPDWLKRDTS
ncbi:hypothetical protein D0Z07_5355 [Hyphodiscus hymeniophilus]|uniref:Uncharacterized protein n=1 Tax=Hyphodiscus hymeniophilus TaxID=353542 RepID=A0A9P6VHK2_9HELO|nr:hypothetical protein D0Z07_5355 [Hyphodiscus hymeniophilus]